MKPEPSEVKPITPKEVKPISPAEVKTLIPKEVILAFNELIAENFCRNKAVVYQNRVVERIMQKLRVSGDTETTRHMIFDRGWLDIEDLFRKSGWNVKYDKPGWDESYEAHFIFTKKAGKRHG